MSASIRASAKGTADSEMKISFSRLSSPSSKVPRFFGKSARSIFTIVSNERVCSIIYACNES